MLTSVSSLQRPTLSISPGRLQAGTSRIAAQRSSQGAQSRVWIWAAQLGSEPLPQQGLRT